MFRGKPDYSQKANFRILSPFLPKNQSGRKILDSCLSDSIRIHSLNPLNSLYFQGFFSPYPEKQNDLIERIFPLYKVVLLLLILFLGLPQIAFAGYSGVPRDRSDYSSSIVPGGLLVRSYTTRLTPFTSLIIRFITPCSTAHGISALSAVIKSIVLTARSTTA